MSACSAACRVPSRARHPLEPGQLLGLGQEPDRLRLEASSPAGRAAPPRSSCRRARTCAGRRPPARSPTTAPKESSRPSRRSTRRASTIAVVVSFFACVYQSPVNGAHDGGARVVVELEHEVRSRRGAGRPRPRGRSSTRARARPCRARRRSPPSTTVNESGEVERSETARGRVVPPGPDPARRRALELGEGGGALERGVAEHVARRPRPAGASKAAESTWPSRTRGLSPSRMRRLDAPPEQRLGLAHEVLVERVLARDQHREAVAAPARRGPTAGGARRPCRGSRRRSPRRARRCRCRARARRSRSRRAARPRPGAARSRAAARACSRRGRARAGRA